jgi:hypothetical protein
VRSARDSRFSTCSIIASLLFKFCPKTI